MNDVQTLREVEYFPVNSVFVCVSEFRISCTSQNVRTEKGHTVHLAQIALLREESHSI